MAVLRYRVTHTGIAGTPYLSTFHADSTVTTASALRDGVQAFWASTADRRVSDLISLGEAQVDELDPGTGALIGSSAVASFNVPATGSGSAAPAATQGLLRIGTNTILGGRRIEGKLFLPGVRQNDVTGLGLVLLAYRTAYENAAADLRSATGNGWCVWTRANGGTVTTSQASVWEQFAVLRSRRD